jgi:hypothetical protein
MSEEHPAPLFTSAEAVVRCWYRGIPHGCKALPLEREGGTGSELVLAGRLYDRSERYVVACAVMRRAQAAGLSQAQEVVLVGLLVEDVSWERAAGLAGLDDGAAVETVNKRVYRALHAGLRLVREAM